MKKKLLIIELNEINFDLAKNYIENGHNLENFTSVLNSFTFSHSTSEEQYENLEPWIQWVSAHTGKSYFEHKIFRLGDIENKENPEQIFEKLERLGFSVGAVSPMNAINALESPKYFIPDPWTNTSPDNSRLSKKVFKMLKQTVNDNSMGKISLSSVLTIIELVLRTLDIKNLIFFVDLVAKSVLKKKWMKPMVLDYLIHKLHLKLFKKHQPDVSFVFLNGGAHIQHHYFSNSPYASPKKENPKWYIDPEEDPILDMLIHYDNLIGEYLKLDQKLIIATGLSQIPFGKNAFYWRLKDHRRFLDMLGIKYLDVLPRMTRDFEIRFSNLEDQEKCKNILQAIKVKRDGKFVFEEVEERRNSIFVTLTYEDEIFKDDRVVHSSVEINLYDQVTFVAIKNGMHSSKGYVMCSPNIKEKFKENDHIKNLNNLIIQSMLNQ